MENRNPYAYNSRIDEHFHNEETHQSDLVPLTPTTPSANIPLSSIHTSSVRNTTNMSMTPHRNVPYRSQHRYHPPPLYSPSPSRNRLDSEYSSRLPSHPPPLHLHHHQHHASHSFTTLSSTPSSSSQMLSSPPGIRRGRIYRNQFSIFNTSSSEKHDGSLEMETNEDFLDTSSNRSKTNLPSAFFGTTLTTPDRTSSTATPSSSSTTSKNLSFSPDQGNHPHRTYSGRTTLASTPTYTSPNLSTTVHASVSMDTTDAGYADRFIPSRATSNLSLLLSDSNNVRTSISSLGSSGINDGNVGNNDPINDATDVNITTDGGGNDPDHVNHSPARGGNEGNNNSQTLLNALLRSELLGSTPSDTHFVSSSSGPSPTNNNNDAQGRGARNENFDTPQRENVFRFQNTPRLNVHERLRDSYSTSSIVNSFHLSPVASASGHRLLAAPQKRKRKIGKVPFKVLDAPSLQDDFYLNLVDWSSQNVLAVGLGSCVYLWSACTSKVTKLCDLSISEDVVTSVSWTQRGTHLAIGTNHGEIQIWDTIQCTKLRTMGGHSARIGTLSWNDSTLASGSRDRLICLRDVRSSQQVTTRLSAHRQEVCGLKWSFDEPSQLASGGNDNKLLVWDIKNHSQPMHRFADHTAAVKAIAWSPHQHGLLASGGGTADRCIRFWNTLNGTGLSCVDTGSQVCNLAWSQNCNEIVSTHGYSLNQIVVWRYPSMSKVATLTGHTYRVLYLAVSPDGSTIVTGAGDETLRFWQVFPGPRSHEKSAGNLLFPVSSGSIIR